MAIAADPARPLPPARAEAAAAARAARTKTLLEGPVGPTLARLAAPNVVAMLVMSMMVIAESWYASRLGLSALAGTALVVPLVMLTQMLSSGAMGGATSAAVARALGAGDVRRAERIVLHVWIIALTCGLGAGALMWVWGEDLFRLLGGRGEALDAALAYAGVYFTGAVMVWLANLTLSILRGTGNMMMASVGQLLVSLLTIPFGGVLALGWGDFEGWGMAGLAAGQIAAFSIGAVAAIGYLAAGRSGLSLAGAFGRLERALFADVLRVGLLASVSSVQTVLTIVIMVGVVGAFGEAALAGYGLGTRLEFMMIPVCFGIGAAMTAMVGANIGAGQKERALRIAWTGSLAAACIVGAIGLFFAIFPDVWLGMFLAPENTGALEAGRLYFRIIGPFYFFFALGLAFYFASQGAARVLWPMLGGVIRLVVAAGGGLIVAGWLGGDLGHVFMAVAAGMTLFGLAIAASVWITRWR